MEPTETSTTPSTVSIPSLKLDVNDGVTEGKDFSYNTILNLDLNKETINPEIKDFTGKAGLTHPINNKLSNFSITNKLSVSIDVNGGFKNVYNEGNLSNAKLDDVDDLLEQKEVTKDKNGEEVEKIIEKDRHNTLDKTFNNSSYKLFISLK